MDSLHPQYLHIVIGSEAEETDKFKKNATIQDLMKLQNVLLTEMEKGIIQKEDQHMSTEMATFNADLVAIEIEGDNEPINHETVFIPYYTESKQSPLDMQTNSLITLLGKQGKKKGCRSERAFRQYIRDKLEQFMSDSLSNDDFMK
jgi:hypothetical protein